MTKNKNYEYSFLRFVATVMIIFCHIFEEIGYKYGVSERLGILGNFLAVGVQIFLLLSGMLYGRKKDLFDNESSIGFVARNFGKILKPYYVYVFLVIFPVYYVVDFRGNGLKCLIVNVFNVLTCSGTIAGVHHLWFIPYILLCYLITPALYEIKRISTDLFGEAKGLFVLLFVMAVLVVIDVAYDSYFIAIWINCYVVGFWGGNLLENFIRKSKKGILFLIVAFISVTILWYEIRYVIAPLYSDITLLKKACEYAINITRSIDALIISVIVLFGAQKWLCNIPKFNSFLEYSDKYSYDVFIVHMIYVKGVFSLVGLTGNYLINIAIVILVILFSAVVFHKICDFMSGYGRKIENNFFAVLGKSLKELINK